MHYLAVLRAVMGVAIHSLEETRALRSVVLRGDQDTANTSLGTATTALGALRPL